jgi:hypothetical protein
METTDQILHSDSISARCPGLLNCIARKQSDNSEVFASKVTKADGPFYCPSCLSDAIVRKCTEKKDHFAHKSRQSPIILSKDIELHNKCRDEICLELQSRFPEGKWATERTIPENKNKGIKERKPDISGRINGKPIAIEVQASSYTIERIYQKTIDYFKLGISVLWIIPLKTELGNEPFRPRLFEKYLHSLYYGKAYYYLPGESLTLIPVHFSPAKRWIEETSWFEEGGIERNEGGYFLTYRTIKMPNYGLPVDISKDFTIIEHFGFSPKNVKKEIPRCSLLQSNLKNWWDKAEFYNLKKQFEVIKKSKSMIIDWEDFDDYDDFEDNDIN